MQALLEMHLRPDHEFDRTRSVGLVIGAGGTSRAAVWTLHAFGVKTIYLYNRTLANAVKVANVFPSSYDVRPITSLDPTQFDEPPIAILSTIPGEGTATPLHSNPDAGVFLPESIFARPQGGAWISAVGSLTDRSRHRDGLGLQAQTDAHARARRVDPARGSLDDRRRHNRPHRTG